MPRGRAVSKGWGAGVLGDWELGAGGGGMLGGHRNLGGQEAWGPRAGDFPG